MRVQHLSGRTTDSTGSTPARRSSFARSPVVAEAVTPICSFIVGRCWRRVIRAVPLLAMAAFSAGSPKASLPSGAAR
jgi:hypothetical protein